MTRHSQALGMLALGLSVFLASLGLSAVAAQEDQGEAVAGKVDSWKLRRVLVPEKKLDEVIRGRYLPLRVDRFDELLEANRSQADIALQWPFDGLWLEGKFDPAGRLTGSGLLALNLPTKQPWIRQPIPSLHLSDLRWLELDGQLARAGLGPGQQWLIENIGARQLAFNWSTTGKSVELPGPNGESRAGPLVDPPVSENRNARFGPTSYSIEFPGVVQTTLILSLPVGWTVSSSDGMCRLLPMSPRLPNAVQRIWRIDFSRGSSSRLIVQPDSQTVPASSKAKFIADTLLRLRPGVVESRTTLQWTERATRDVHFTLPDSWKVTKIRSGSVDLPFEFSDERGSRRFRVDLSGRTEDLLSLQISAERLFEFGEPLTLEPPHLEGTWLRGSLALELSSELQIDRWNLLDGKWMGPVVQAGGLRRLTAQCFKKTCRLDLVVSPAQAQASGVALTQVKAEGQKLTATVEAWIDPGSAPRLEWRMPLQEGWIVDQVATYSFADPNGASLVDSWDIIQVDSPAALLDVHLKQPFPEGQQMRLVIEAHYLTFPSPLDPLSPDALGVVDLHTNSDVEHWLAVQAEPPYRFEWKGQLGQTIKPTPTDEKLLAWKNANPTGRLMLLEGVAEAGRFELQTELVNRFDADYEVRCVVGDRTVQQSVKIFCRPVESRLNQVRLTWPSPNVGNWTWSLEVSGTARHLTITPVEERTVTNESVSTLLQWGEGIDQPFVIVGQSSQVWDQSWSPQLPRIDRSQRRTGSLTVSSIARESINCRATDITRLPASATVIEVDQRLLGVYELAETLAADVPLKERLLVTRDPGPAQRSQHLIWSRRLSSWPGAAETHHRLSLDVKVGGAKDIELQAPPSAMLKRVLVNGQNVDVNQIVVAAEPGGTATWHIPLTSVPTQQLVEVDFTTGDRLGQLWQMLSAPFPLTDSAVFQSQWVVHVPSGYRILADDATPAGGDFVGWTRWLVARWTGIVLDDEPRPSLGESPAEGATTDNSILVDGDHRRATRHSGVELERLWVRPGASAGASAQFLHLDGAQSVYWLTLFACAAVVVAGTSGRKYWAWLVLVGLALAIPWLPSQWQVWTTALLPGSLLACFIQVFRSPRTVATYDATTAAIAPAQASPAAFWWLILTGTLALLLWQTASMSAQEAARPAPSRQRLVDVIIPLDAEGRPSQDLVFLPQEFLDQLLKSAPRGEVTLPWVLESSRHVIDIESNPFSEQTRWRLTSRLRLRTLQTDVRFELPFSADQVLLLADQIELDQSIARVVGTPDNGLQVLIENPGYHELVVPGVLLIQGSMSETFEWDPPRVPDSEYRINGLMASGWDLETPSPRSAVDDLGVDRLRFTGPTPQLRFRLHPSTVEPLAGSPEVGIAEVIQSDGDRFLVTIWFRPIGNESLPADLKFLVGPGWEVQANAIPASADFRLSRLGDESVCELRLPSEGPPVDLAGIQLRSSQSLLPGRWPLPSIRTDNAVVSSRQLVLDPPANVLWEYEGPTESLASQMRDKLSSKWSSSQLEKIQLDAQDPVVLEVPVTAVSEYLTIAPEPSILAVDQQVDLTLAWNATRFDCSSIVSVMRGQVDSLELHGNIPFRLERFVIEGTPEAREIDVVPLAPDRYLVVFATPQRSAFQLRFTGQVQGETASQIVPVFRFAGISDVTYRCHLQRDPLLQTKLTRDTASEQADEGSNPIDLAVIDRDLQNLREANVQLSANQLQQVATWQLRTDRIRQPMIEQVLVSFRRDGTDWRVQMWLQVSPQEPWGLEVVDVELPEGFVPLNSNVDGRWIEGNPTESRERRRWRAATRVNPGSWTYLEGTLPRFPDGPLVPRLANSEVGQYRIALPRAQQADPFLWQHDAEEVDSTEDLSGERLLTSIDWLVLKRNSPQNTIRLASKPLVVRPTHVHLADYRIQWQQDRAAILCRFLIDPGGKNQLPLNLPEGFVVKSILIDGELRDLPAGELSRLELVNRELPQEVVLWCEAPLEQLPAPGWQHQVLPALEIPAEVSTVAFMRSRSDRPLQLDGLEAISAAQWQQIQSRASQRVLEVAPTTTLLSQQALGHWIEFWRQNEAENAFGSASADGRERESAAVDEAGQIIWRAPQREPEGEAEIEGRLSMPEPNSQWRYYRPRTAQPPIELTAENVIRVNHRDLSWVTAVLAVGFVLLGIGAWRLSERARFIMLLLLTLAVSAALTFLHGSNWLGPIVIGAVMLGLLRLIFMPGEALVNLVRRR